MTYTTELVSTCTVTQPTPKYKYIKLSISTDHSINDLWISDVRPWI